MPDGPPDDRLNEILDEVLDLPAEARAAFLDDACRDDPALRTAVERLLAHASPADDFLERPARTPPAVRDADAPRFEPGALLAGRFRLVRLLGRGGMGEVYEATDGELGTPVAIKMIRAASAADPAAIDRFRREVVRARAVAHPNVCRVHDLFAHGEPPHEVRFLTMELVAGETLADRLLRDGHLPPAEAARVATQVAAAIDEAHRLEIVHRDLKPGNIMLAPTAGGGVRAVVTDFGLAGQLAEASPLGARIASTVLGGTDDYMAPEQRATGAVGPAADVYAFAVVVHEMLTGETPQDGALAPSLPAPWVSALRPALEPDPAKRPASATAIVQRAIPRRRAALLGLVAVVAAVVSLFVGWLRPWEGRASAATSATVVMAPIENSTKEPALDAVTDMLRNQLAQSPFLTLLRPSQVAEALERMAKPTDTELTPELARDVAWRRQADVILSGRIQPASQGYVLSTRLERRGARPDVVGDVWTRTFEARDRAELLRILQEAGRWVRGTAGEAAADIPKTDRPVEEVTSPSWAAVALYSEAESVSGRKNFDEKIALYREAVRADPDFALAWMRMGDLQMSNRHLEEGGESWSKARAVMERRQLTKREEYRIRGLYAHDTRNYEEAEHVYRLWLRAYPNDVLPFFYIARPLMLLGRTDDAIQMLEEARKREPDAHYILANLAMLHLRAGHLEAAREPIAALRRIDENGWADCVQGQLDFLAGDAASALARFESLPRSKDPEMRTKAASMQAALLADTGRLQEALARLEAGIAADVAAGRYVEQADKLLHAATLELALGRSRACRDRCVLIEQIDQSSERLAQVAGLFARAGFPAEAERLMRGLAGNEPTRGLEANRERVRGEILLARGQARQAWVSFQRAATLDPPGIPHEYLARGALAAGETGAAHQLYERMAGDIGYYWQSPDFEPIGTWYAARQQLASLIVRPSTSAR